jgi:hypothetical protein
MCGEGERKEERKKEKSRQLFRRHQGSHVWSEFKMCYTVILAGSYSSALPPYERILCSENIKNAESVFNDSHALQMFPLIVYFSKPSEWPILIHQRSCKETSQGNTWNGTFSTCCSVQTVYIIGPTLLLVVVCTDCSLFSINKGSSYLDDKRRILTDMIQQQGTWGIHRPPLAVDPISRPCGKRAVNRKLVQLFGEPFHAPQKSFVKK